MLHLLINICYIAQLAKKVGNKCNTICIASIALKIACLIATASSKLGGISIIIEF